MAGLQQPCLGLGEGPNARLLVEPRSRFSDTAPNLCAPYTPTRSVSEGGQSWTFPGAQEAGQTFLFVLAPEEFRLPDQNLEAVTTGSRD